MGIEGVAAGDDAVAGGGGAVAEGAADAPPVARGAQQRLEGAERFAGNHTKSHAHQDARK